MTPDEGMAALGDELRPSLSEGASIEAWLDAQADLVARVVARGRVVARFSDGTGGRYAVHVALVEHPDLPAGEVYALFDMPANIAPRVYRATPEAARAAVHHYGAFNLT